MFSPHYFEPINAVVVKYKEPEPEPDESTPGVPGVHLEETKKTTTRRNKYLPGEKLLKKLTETKVSQATRTKRPKLDLEKVENSLKNLLKEF